MMLQDKVAIVTGGAKGMGSAIAKRFAQEGAKVVIADISMAEANETLAEIQAGGGEGLVCECDVTSSDSVREMVAATVDRFGGLDILVNNAGSIVGAKGTTPNSVTAISEDSWDRVVDLNLKGGFLCAKEAVPHMKSRGGGRIVNISSLGAIHPPAPQPHYHAAKAGVLGLTYDMACELGPHGIQVNAIMPGPIRTPFYDGILAGKSDEEVEGFFKMLGSLCPLQRMGTPEDIAGVALFLVSDLSSYVTGVVIPVSGGLPLQPSAH